MASDLAAFDALFATSDDPWQFERRWYEARKRALTLACLPRPRYASAYEPGCANGVLSAALASRCDRLLASDGAARAVELARLRLAEQPHVRVIQARTPEEWPEERFDLIVLSEFGYFLDPPDLDSVAVKASAGLTADGVVLACHWRRPIAGCFLDGDAVHLRLGQALGLSHLISSVDADLRIDVWCTDPRSVATREGLST